MTHLLFVCTDGRHRSVTGAEVWRDGDAAGLGPFDTRSAGTLPDALDRVRASLVDWADVVVCMEERHARDVRWKFPEALGEASIVTLGIPDDYQRGDPQLVALLRERLPEELADMSDQH